MSWDRLRQVAEDATPGPWRLVGDRGIGGDPGEFVVFPFDGHYGGIEILPDAVHIATFDPPTVKALLDVAECAREAADEPWVGGIDAQPASSLTVAEVELREALDRLREVTS